MRKESKDARTAREIRPACVWRLEQAAGQMKARFYRMALRSATETGGTVRIIEDDTGHNELFAEFHAVNYELVAKLTKLASNKQRKKSKPQP